MSNFNIYCDESGHLEKDSSKVMVLGALTCERRAAIIAGLRLKEIRRKHGLAENFEIKWSKVSPAKVEFYVDVIDYYFDDDDLQFRSLVADKSRLDHARFEQSHDDWYYKMFFQLLHPLISSEHQYNIYLDIKDTRSAAKAAHLKNVLCNSKLDFSYSVISRIQNVRSHRVPLVQLADLLIGVVSYANRNLSSNAGKTRLVDRVRERSRKRLTATTLLQESKMNIFVWSADWGSR